MSVRIWKDFTFSAAHTVDSLPEGHQCRRMHGHTYTVRVWISGKIDMPTGMCAGVDFDKIKEAWTELADGLDHRVLNDKLGSNATVEMLAIFIFAQMQLRIPQVCRVDVGEGPTAGASVGA